MFYQILPRLPALALALTFASCATDGGGGTAGGGGGSAVPAETSAPGSATKIHRLSIGRVASAPLSNAQADAILAGATRVLRNRDSGSDVSANVILQRRGDVRVIAGPAVIESQEDYTRLGRSGVQIAIVEALRFCTAPKPGILGCSHIGGSFMALVRRSSLEDIIWAHEFGHNCGLNHRSVSSALMNPEAGPSRRALIAGEARSFERKTAGSGSTAIVAAPEERGAEMPPADADDYLRRVYVHGIPYAHVAGFGAGDVPRFQTVLADPARQAQWLNASVALGAIGTPEAVESVRGFVRGGRGRLGHDAYQARLGAVLGLGYGLRRSGSGSALEQLAGGCAVDSWLQEVRWTAPGGQSREETARTMTAASYSGLALSGAPEAVELLGAALRKNAEDSPLHRAARSALTELRKVRGAGPRRSTEPRGR